MAATSSKIIASLLALAVIAGILGAQWLSKRDAQIVDEPIANVQTIITEILLARLADPTQREEPNPVLTRELRYTTADLLALRVTTRPDIIQPIQIGARLLTPEGRIVELDPPSMTLAPGQSTFCCWQVAEPAIYTLQLFRPEGIVSTIPLEVRKAPTTTVPKANLF
ncbi:MAG: hypothetical protein HYR90_03910 [Candidatus Andersenbacteria bacterium]|nr:hypothetical protein [Candidatus Andersenbacteria bacterium]MBI3250404.1 hypothetical protein [Candidatus Andersenbacteria bacterium]